MKLEFVGKTMVQYGGVEYPINEFESQNKFLYFLAPIRVDDLELDIVAQPRAYDSTNAKKIAQSIKNKTIMQPILVRYIAQQDQFLIIEGQHRWRAIKDFLKLKRIPAIVYIDMQSTIAAQCGLEANQEDRAKALTGGDFAKKIFSLIDLKKQELAAEQGTNPNTIAEEFLFMKLGWETKSKVKKGIIGFTVESIRRSEASKLSKYVADRQSKIYPLTAKNLSFFLKHLLRLSAIQIDEKQAISRENELQNIIELTNIFTEVVLENKWNLKATNAEAKNLHEHAKHLCLRFPFEAVGYLFARTLSRHGGADQRLGAAFIPHESIKWDETRKDIKQLLDSNAWDTIDVYTERNIDNIIKKIDGTSV